MNRWSYLLLLAHRDRQSPMATLLRTAKSGGDWGTHELHSYNIGIQFQDAATFFGVNPLPQPDEILTSLRYDKRL